MDHCIEQTNMSELDFANLVREFTTRMTHLEPVLQALTEAAPSTEANPNVGRALLIAGEAARKVHEVISQSKPALEILLSRSYPNDVDKGIVNQAEQGAMYDRAERHAIAEMAAMRNSHRRPRTVDERLAKEAGIEYELEETRDRVEAARVTLDTLDQRSCLACSPKPLSAAELAQITAENQAAEDAAAEAEERDRRARRRIRQERRAPCRHCDNLFHVKELTQHETNYCIQRPRDPPPLPSAQIATVEPRAHDKLAMLKAKLAVLVAAREQREAELAQIMAENQAARDAWEAEEQDRLAQIAANDAWKGEERERVAERKQWIDEMRKWQGDLAVKMERRPPPKSAMKGKRRRVQLSRTDVDEDYDSDGFQSQCALEKVVLGSLRRKKASANVREDKDKVAHIARKSAASIGPRPRKQDISLGGPSFWRLRPGKNTIPRADKACPKCATATRDCNPEVAPEVPALMGGYSLLEFKPGAIIDGVWYWRDSDWLTGEYQGKTGAFPASYVETFRRNRKWEKSKSKNKRKRKKQAMEKREG